MKKFAVIFALVFAGVCGLGAQSGRSTLFIQEFSGGQGYDGKNFAAILAEQDVFRDNFVIVRSARQADYLVTGVITRTGVGYTLTVNLEDSAGTLLAVDELYYRSALGAGAYLSDVAANLAFAVDPVYAPFDSDAPVRPEAPVEPERIPVPEVAEVPRQTVTPEGEEPREPARTQPRQRQPARQPQTQTPPRAAPETSNAWQNNMFYLGVGFEFAPDIGFGGEVDWRFGRLFGVRLGLESRNFGTTWKERQLFYNGTTGSENTVNKDISGFAGYLALALNMPLNNSMMLGFSGGMGWGNVENRSYYGYKSTGSYSTTYNYTNGASGGGLGVYLGANYDYKLGPGSIYANLSYIHLWGLSDTEWIYNNSNPNYSGYSGYRVRNDSLSSFGVAIGYRIGFGAKR